MSTELVGCSSHGCAIVKPVGQGTNGPCQCKVGDWRGQSLIRGLKERILELETSLEIEPDFDCDGIEARNATIHLLERRIDEYRDQVKELQDNIDDLLPARREHIMSKFTSAALLDFAEAIYAGAELEHLTDSGWTALGTSAETVDALLHSWRIKPAKKIIDMAHFIKSGVDCEFSDTGNSWCLASRLVRINEDNYSDGNDVWKHCQPRMNHKMYHDGCECPLPEGFEIELYYRDTAVETISDYYFGVRWDHNGSSIDIIGYKIIRKLDDWDYA